MSPSLLQEGPPSFTPTCLLLDLDDTLYQVEEIPDIVRRNIQDYMGQHLGIPQDKIASLCLEYYTKYGTTMAGLVANGYQIDFDHWHDAVHGTLPYERLLRRDDKLRQLLQSIHIPMYIFTNADRKHADRCLQLMGVADLFQGVICFESLQLEGQKQGYVQDNKPVICKPNKLAIEMALAAAGAKAAKTIFCDDSVRNVTGAHSAGVFSVLVGRMGVGSSADLEVASLHDLKEALPGLWRVPPSSLPVLATGHWPFPQHASAVPAVMRAQGCEVPEEEAAGCDGGSRREADERPVSANEELHEESRRSWEIEVAAGR